MELNANSDNDNSESDYRHIMSAVLKIKTKEVNLHNTMFESSQTAINEGNKPGKLTFRDRLRAAYVRAQYIDGLMKKSYGGQNNQYLNIPGYEINYLKTPTRFVDEKG
jgi:hypothetical protein